MTLRDRRALVFGGTIVAAAVILLRVLPWSISRTTASLHDLRERAALLGHARAEVSAMENLRDSTARVARALEGLAAKLLSGPSAAEAGADLSGRVNLAAARSQAKIERLDPVADSGVAGRLRRARLRVALESDVRGLAGFLRAVELGDVPLTVEELRVVAPDPGSSERAPEMLKVEVTVLGWYLSNAEVGTRNAEQ